VGAPEKAPTKERLVGGRYELEALIGKGGVGEVWRAKHVALNSPVAIKFLQGASAQKDAARRRFTTEAQVTAQLRTANAVQVFDFGVTEEGHPYLVMELLEGETLGQRLERLERLPALEVVKLLGQCARALQRAHQLGIVHRDFKPDNVVVSVDDQGQEQVKVLDFGVAKLVGTLEETREQEHEPRSVPSPVGSTFSTFTRTGAVLGTPLYMAPEQVKDSADVDLRADIWAFGVVAYECLTGRSPFTAESIEELFRRIQDGNHARASFVEETLPAAFDDWFNVACAPDRERRYPSAFVAFRQLAAALGASDDLLRSGDPMVSSGERRVLVVPDGSSGDRASGPASMNRLGLRTTDRPPPPPPSSIPLAASRTHDGPFRTGSRGWLVGVSGACVLGALAIWTGARRPIAAPATTAASAAQPVESPGPSASVSAILQTYAPPAPTPAPPSAAPVAPAHRTLRTAVSAGTTVAATSSAVPPQPRAATAASVAPQATPPPSPSTAAPDPGSYR
jgi:eukaryotic-like serine/threonine-protein kinase